MHGKDRRPGSGGFSETAFLVMIILILFGLMSLGGLTGEPPKVQEISNG